MLVCPHIHRCKYPSPLHDAAGAEENRRKFGGKELLTELGLNEYDQEARRHIPSRCAFSQPDPLAGKYPWLSPYAFCAADPINLTDPTGQFTTENITANKFIPVICVVPNPLVSFSDPALKIEISAAQQSNMPIVYVDNVSDFKASLNYLKDSNIETRTLSIVSHGTAGSLKIGTETITTETDLSELSEYTSGKNIVVRSCNSGSGEAGASLTTALSSDLDATVITSMHINKAGYTYNGENMNNYQDKKGEPTKYLLSVKGSPACVIENVSINRKTWTIQWNSRTRFIPFRIN